MPGPDCSQEGARALAEQRYADAAQAYETLSELSPDVAEVHASLGFIYFQQRKFIEAVPALRQALKLKPALPNVAVLLAMSLSELGRYDEALPGLEKAFTQVGRRRAPTHGRPAAAARLHRTSSATRKRSTWRSQLTRLYPKDPEVLYHASRLFANFAYLTLSELARGRAGLGLGAPRRRRSQREPGHGRCGAERISGGAGASTPSRPGVHFRLGRVLLARSSRATADGRDRGGGVEGVRAGARGRSDATPMPRTRSARSTARRDSSTRPPQSFRKALSHYPEFEEALVGLGRTLIAARRSRRGAAASAEGHRAEPARRGGVLPARAGAPGARRHRGAGKGALAAFERLRARRRARNRRGAPAHREAVTKQIESIRHPPRQA